MSDFSVTIWPEGKVVNMNEKSSLLAQLKFSGYDIKSTCGGCASCGDCKVLITAGDENLNEASFEEKQLIGNVFHITKERLACQTNISGAVTIDISNHLDNIKPKKASTVRRTREEASEIVEKRKEIYELKKQGAYIKKIYLKLKSEIIYKKFSFLTY